MNKYIHEAFRNDSSEGEDIFYSKLSLEDLKIKIKKECPIYIIFDEIINNSFYYGESENSKWVYCLELISEKDSVNYEFIEGNLSSFISNKLVNNLEDKYIIDFKYKEVRINEE